MHSGGLKPPVFCDLDRASAHLEDDFFSSTTEDQATGHQHAAGDFFGLMRNLYVTVNLVGQRAEWCRPLR